MIIEWLETEIKLKDLKEYDKNPRYINKHEFDLLVKSIQENGYHNRILVDHNNRMIGGHQRKKAFKAIGLKDSDLIKVLKPNCEISEEQFREINITDNLPLGNWDFEILGNEWDQDELINIGFPKHLLNFDLDNEEEISEFSEILEGEIKEPEKVITVLGDLWQLGNHRLLCGDSTNINDYKNLLDNQLIDMVITSPPYNQGNKGIKKDYKNKTNLYINNIDQMKSEDYIMFCLTVLDNIEKFSKDYSTIIWNTSYNANSRNEYGKILFNDNNPFTVKETIIWDKGHGFPSASKGIFSRRCELIYVLSRGEKYFTNQGNDEVWFNFWQISSLNSQIKEHNACFPINLPLKAIECFAEDNFIIFDPFAGTGTTLMACENTGNISYNIELEPKYCDIIINRWQDMTGKKAIHVETGKTYNELIK